MTLAEPGPGRALPLGRLELAAGQALGWSEQNLVPGYEVPRSQLPTGGSLTPRAALEAEVLAGLRRPPCLVSFSGGRDSSAVLAVACRVARREGLADPVPVTMRFPGVVSAQESDWQDLVVGHLGLKSWEKLAFDQELDLLGDIGCAALRTHGLLWPPNVYMHAPLLERARGGSLLTGIDGDGLLGGWRWLRPQQVLHARLAPRPRDLLRIGLALAPARVRRWRSGLDPGVAFPWLRPLARAEVGTVLAEEAAAEPRRWDRRVRWYARSRYLALAEHSLAILGNAREVVVGHPLLGAGFLSALAAAGGGAGLGGRTELMRLLVADLLPEAVLARTSKAEFRGAMWGERARSFAGAWSGVGIDPALVDHEVLRAHWRQGRPYSGSLSLLQAAWLAEDCYPGGRGN